jgi:hypothetical protein
LPTRFLYNRIARIASLEREPTAASLGSQGLWHYLQHGDRPYEIGR